MKQILFSSFGQPSAVANCVEVAELTAPAAWEVIVRIEAFPVNAADLAIMSGRYGTLPKLPAPIGLEAVGTVEQCGDAVENCRVGDRVILLANNNWAEKRKVAAAAVHKVPSDLDPIQMCMLKVNPATAQLLLDRFETLHSGEWVVQNAPLGSVGQSVIQIAKTRGLRTVSIVRDINEKAETLHMGGDVAIVSGPDAVQQVKAAVGHAPVRLALDACAGRSTQELAETLTENGTVVNYGMLSGEACQIDAAQTIFRNIALRGFWLSKILNRLSLEERTQLYGDLCMQIASGGLTLQVDCTFAFTEIEQALKRAEQHGRRGKVIVSVRNN